MVMAQCNSTSVQAMQDMLARVVKSFSTNRFGASCARREKKILEIALKTFRELSAVNTCESPRMGAAHPFFHSGECCRGAESLSHAVSDGDLSHFFLPSLVDEDWHFFLLWGFACSKSTGWENPGLHAGGQPNVMGGQIFLA